MSLTIDKFGIPTVALSMRLGLGRALELDVEPVCMGFQNACKCAGCHARQDRDRKRRALKAAA